MSKKCFKVTVFLLLVVMATCSAFSKSADRIEDILVSENVSVLEEAGGQVLCAWNPFSLCIRSDQWGTEVWPHYMAIESTNEEDE